MTLTPRLTNAEVIDEILARVGSKAITLHDVQNLDPVKYKEILMISDPEYRQLQLKDFEKQALEFLINQAIIATAAEREGISVKDSEVDLAIAEIVARNNLELDKLEATLEKEGMSLAKYKFQLKNDILNARVRSQVLMPKIVVVEEDIRKIVDENPEDYKLYDKYKVRLLVVQDKAAMKKVLSEIKGGLSFDEAVKKYSLDKSAANGGEIGYLEPAILSGDMKDALKNAKVGKVTETFSINSQVGVFMVDEFKSKYDFDNETRKKLQEKAAEKNFQSVFTRWLEKNKETMVIMRAGEGF